MSPSLRERSGGFCSSSNESSPLVRIRPREVHPAPVVGRGPISCSEEWKRSLARTLTGHHHVLPIDRRPRGFSPPRRFGVRVRSEHVAARTDRVHTVSGSWEPKFPFAPDQHGPAPGAACKQAILGEDDCAILGVRAPLEGFHIPAASPCHQVDCPPAVHEPRFDVAFASVTRGCSTSRPCSAEMTGPGIDVAVVCPEPPPSIGFLVPLQSQRSNHSLNASSPRGRSHLAGGDATLFGQLAVARPRSSSWGRTSRSMGIPAHRGRVLRWIPLTVRGLWKRTSRVLGHRLSGVRCSPSS